MFAKRHYETIAMILRDQKRESDSMAPNDKARRQAIGRETANRFADHFARNHMAFKRETFMAACGYPD